MLGTAHPAPVDRLGLRRGGLHPDQLVVATLSLSGPQQLDAGDIPVEEGRRVGRRPDGNTKCALRGIQHLRVLQLTLLHESQCAGRDDVDDYEHRKKANTVLPTVSSFIIGRR